MKRTLLSLGALALLLTSCDTSNKDSYQTISYPEYNLIADTQDRDAPAQTSYSNYDVKFNISKNVIDIKTSDIIINNQKYSFETDTMQMRTQAFNVDGIGTAQNYLFSKTGTVGVGSAASNLNGKLVWYYAPSGSSIYLSDKETVLAPGYTVSVGQSLDLSYVLNGRYDIQTFRPIAFYKGTSVTSSDGLSHTSKVPEYLAHINFEKKTATVDVYNAEYSADQASDFPKLIRFAEIPVIFTNDGFSLESASPKTTVLAKKGNVTTLVDSVGFAATDFSLLLTSSDLTDAIINYNFNGKHVYFHGCSILKSSY